MSEPEVSTYHQDGSWYNRIEGASQNVSGPFRTKEEAVEAAYYYAGRHHSGRHGSEHEGHSHHEGERD